MAHHSAKVCADENVFVKLKKQMVKASEKKGKWTFLT